MSFWNAEVDNQSRMFSTSGRTSSATERQASMHAPKNDVHFGQNSVEWEAHGEREILAADKPRADEFE